MLLCRALHMWIQHGKALCNKISGIIKLCVATKFMKLKLKHFAHAALVTTKYSRSMVRSLRIKESTHIEIIYNLRTSCWNGFDATSLFTSQLGQLPQVLLLLFLLLAGYLFFDLRPRPHRFTSLLQWSNYVLHE